MNTESIWNTLSILIPMDIATLYKPLCLLLGWLVHNIKKLHSISKVYLLKLFQAKRAYILKQWLMLTRILPPNHYGAINQHMELLRVDKELAKLSGTVYDIRDYLYEGIHHKYKLKLYRKLRGNLIQTMQGGDIRVFMEHNETLRPFLKEYYYNQTDGRADDDAAIANVGHITDGDTDSNEEYAVY